MFGIAGTAELSTFCPGTGTWNRLQDGKLEQQLGANAVHAQNPDQDEDDSGIGEPFKGSQAIQDIALNFCKAKAATISKTFPQDPKVWQSHKQHFPNVLLQNIGLSELDPYLFVLKDAIIIFVACEEFFGVAIVCPYCGTKKGSSTTNDKGETVSVQSKGFLMRLKQVVTPNGKIFLIFQKEYGCTAQRAVQW